MDKTIFLDITDSKRLMVTGKTAEDIIAEVVNNVKVGLCFFYANPNRNFETIYLNEEYFKMLKYEKTPHSIDIVGMLGAILREDTDGVYEKILSSVERKMEFDYFTYGYTSENERRWYRFKGFPLDNSERVIYMMIISDVTDEMVNYEEYREYKRVKDEILIERQRYRILEETVEALLFEYDIRQDVMIFSYNFPNNHERKIINNYSKVLENNPMVHSAYIEKFKNTLNEACTRNIKGSLEYLSEVSGNGYQWHRTHYTSITDNKDKIIAVMGRIYNIHDEVEARNKYQHDGLTGAYIRSAGYECIENYRKNHMDEECYLVLLDLDNFKYINDHYGHLEGDNALKYFTQQTINLFNDNGIVVRYGGDEILVFSHGISCEEINSRIDKLREGINAICEGKLDFCSGVTRWEDETLDEVFGIADKKMYDEKKEKNTNENI